MITQKNMSISDLCLLSLPAGVNVPAINKQFQKTNVAIE